MGNWGTAGSGDGEFQNPQDVAIDSLGNLYVTDTNNHRIQKFDNNGQFIIEWGTFGSNHGEICISTRLAFLRYANYDLSDLANRVQCLSNEITNLEGQKRNLMNKVILWNAQLSDLGKAIDHKNQQLKRMGK